MDKVTISTLTGNCDKETCNIVSEENKDAYTYDEAMDLAGSGRYDTTLMAVLSLSLLSMGIDLFSFSVVIAVARCDLQLDLMQTSIMVTVPFLGPILTAYAWGYVSDIKGRKFALVIAMTVSFMASTLGAFTPNWITMTLFKLISTCFSSCAQSVSYTLLGESCSERVKGSYLLIMSSVLHHGCTCYFGLAYLIGNLTFSYSLGYIMFVPWRLLVVVLALPLGLSAIILVIFFYESPKFLANAGKEDKALMILKCISKRNGIQIESFPVKKLMLNENNNIRRKDVPLCASLWKQTAPLLKPPLLMWTLLIYYLIIVVYGVNSSMFVWMPFLAGSLTSDMVATPAGQPEGLCDLILQFSSLEKDHAVCTSAIDATIVIAVVLFSLIMSILNLVMAKVASRKKTLTILIFAISCVCCLITPLIPNRYSSLFYFGAMALGLAMGLMFTFIVDLFPTSYRGMAACLGVMMARAGGASAINIVGPLLISHCEATFYGLSAVLLSGALLSTLLPADRPENVSQKK